MYISWLLVIALVFMVLKPTTQKYCHDTKSINNYALDGGQYKVIHTSHYPGCVIECLKDELCKSLNYLMTEGICDLNNRTKDSSPGNFVPRTNSIYFNNVVSATVGQPQMTPVTTQTGPATSTNQAKPDALFTSCRDILVSGNSTGTGTYWIDPGNTGKPLQAWCDMSTNGGGWTVAVNVTLQSATFPTTYTMSDWRKLLPKYSDVGNYYRPTSGLFSKLKQAMHFDQIHFYCFKKTVGRAVSIVTKNNTAGHQVLQYFLNDTYAASGFPDACQSFDKLADDTSVLAQTCTKWGSNTGKWGDDNKRGKYRMTSGPFGFGQGHEFGIDARSKILACDDFDASFSVGDTLLVSVR